VIVAGRSLADGLADLLRLQDDRIALFYIKKKTRIAGHPQVSVSSDEGETWTSPQAVVTAGRVSALCVHAGAARPSTSAVATSVRTPLIVMLLAPWGDGDCSDLAGAIAARLCQTGVAARSLP